MINTSPAPKNILIRKKKQFYTQCPTHVDLFINVYSGQCNWQRIVISLTAMKSGEEGGAVFIAVYLL